MHLLGRLNDNDCGLLRWGKGLVASERISAFHFEELAV